MKILQFFLLLFTSMYCKAQSPKSTKKVDLVGPKAILVLLRTEQNRIKYFEQKKQWDKAEEIRKDADKIMQLTVNDFNDHYTYSSVYYFIDTNLKKVQNKEFAGNLLNEKLEPASNLILSAEDTNYYFVYYGIPNTIDDKNRISPRQRKGKGLIVLDHNYKQKESPFPFFTYKLGYYDLFVPESKYSYVSKKYEMEYFPLAYFLSGNLKHYFFRH